MNKSLIVSLAFCVATASAEIHYVTYGLSIQQAVNNSADGDTVLIAEGVYVETTVLYGKALTIGSQFLMDGDTSHVIMTSILADTLSRPDTASCFVYAYGELPSSRLVGLTLNDGRGTAFLVPGDRPSGGAIYAMGTDSAETVLNVEHCRIEGCRACMGGGIFSSNSNYPFDLVLSHCQFVGCVGTDAGGAIFLTLGSLTANHCLFEADSALGLELQSVGGAIFGYGYSPILLDSCEITACAAWTSAIAITNYCSGVISACHFHNNAVLYNPGATAVDLMCVQSYMTITGCLFDENESEYGAIYVGGTTNWRFVGNVVEDGPTCPNAIGLDGRGDVAYNIFRNYSSVLGGVVYTHRNGAFNPNIRIRHNVFTGNASANPGSPCVLQTMDYRPTFDSNRVAGNAGSTVGNFQGESGIIDARNNWWGDPSGPYHPTLNPTGQGDTLLSDSVLFIPWLTSPPDTTMPPGYLGVDEHPPVPTTWQLLAVYPNPFNSTIRIELAGFAGSDFELTLHNLLGQVVDVVERGPITGGALTYTAPPYLSSGVYFLKAADRHAVITRKVVLLK